MAAITLYFPLFIYRRAQKRAPVLMFERQSGRVCNKFIIPRTRNNNAHSHRAAAASIHLLFSQNTCIKTHTCNAVRDKYDNFWICAVVCGERRGLFLCALRRCKSRTPWDGQAAMPSRCAVFVIQFARDTNNLQISPAATGIFGCCCAAAGKNCCITAVEERKSPPAVRSLLAWQSEFSSSICSFLGEIKPLLIVTSFERLRSVLSEMLF